MDKKVGVGLVGSQFISSIHADALSRVSDAEILAVMSPTKGHAEKFAEKFNAKFLSVFLLRSRVQTCGKSAKPIETTVTVSNGMLKSRMNCFPHRL